METKANLVHVVKGEFLRSAPLKLGDDQIIFTTPEIELRLFRNDESRPERRFEISIEISLPKKTIIAPISYYREEEWEKADASYRELLQALIKGEKKIQIFKEGTGEIELRLLS